MSFLNSKQNLLAIAVIIVGFAFIYFLSNFTNSVRPNLPPDYEDNDLVFKGEKLKDFSLGFNGLIADWYWVQTLQYVGNKLEKSKQQNINIDDLRPINPKLLYPLLDNATSFDPNYYAVYEYGATVLPAVDPNQAVKIIEKGIKNNPSEWRFYNQLGYIYWRTQKYEKAAKAYSEGAKIKGAPDILKFMAAKMTNDGGSRETARQMYLQMFENAQDEQSKKNAELQLRKLDAIVETEAINKVLQDFQTKNGRCANSLSEIFPILQTVKLPDRQEFRIDNANNLVDQMGVPYVLNKQQCQLNNDY